MRCLTALVLALAVVLVPVSQAQACTCDKAQAEEPSCCSKPADAGTCCCEQSRFEQDCGCARDHPQQTAERGVEITAPDSSDSVVELGEARGQSTVLVAPEVNPARPNFQAPLLI